MKFVDRIVHDRFKFINQRFGKFVIQVFRQFIDLRDRRSLRLSQQFDVAIKRVRQVRAFFPSDDSPSRVDDFLLQLRQLHRLLGTRSLLALLLLLAPLPLGFKKDLFEAPNFREKHVTLGATRFTIGSNILRPKMPRNKLVRFGLQRFKLQQMIYNVSFLGVLIVGDFEFLSLAASDRPCQPSFHNAKIIHHRSTHRDLLKRRNCHIASGLK